MLFASGYVDGDVEAAVTAQTEAQISVGVDSIVSALQQLALERQEAPAVVKKAAPSTAQPLP